MKDCLMEMYRVLRRNSVCFVVIGDVRTNGRIINAAEPLARIADSIGFRVVRIINDSIPRAKKYFIFLPEGKGVRLDGIIELHKS